MQFIPKGHSQTLKLSPAVVSRGHIFVTGMTGSLQDGIMQDDQATQFRAAFDKIRSILFAASTDMHAIVEMTSYHIGIHDHFDLLNEVRCEYVSDPFPAWIAVEVAALRRQGAVVEVRVIADAP